MRVYMYMRYMCMYMYVLIHYTYICFLLYACICTQRAVKLIALLRTCNLADTCTHMHTHVNESTNVRKYIKSIILVNVLKAHIYTHSLSLTHTHVKHSLQ